MIELTWKGSGQRVMLDAQDVCVLETVRDQDGCGVSLRSGRTLTAQESYDSVRAALERQNPHGMVDLRWKGTDARTAVGAWDVASVSEGRGGEGCSVSLRPGQRLLTVTDGYAEVNAALRKGRQKGRRPDSLECGPPRRGGGGAPPSADEWDGPPGQSGDPGPHP